MKRDVIILFAVFLPFVSCKQKSTAIIYRNQDFCFEMKFQGSFPPSGSRIVLDNVNMYHRKDYQMQELLYIKFFLSKEYDTLRVKLSAEQSDSIFQLANAYIKSFHFDNTDTVIVGSTTITKSPNDGDVSSLVYLFYKGKSLSAGIDDTRSVDGKYKEYDELRGYLLKLEKKASR